MSLAVDVFVVDDNGEMCVLDVPAGCSDLAGFEDWRTRVWGSQAARELGARLLPRLVDGDLVVSADQVPDLMAECSLLRAGLAAISPDGEGEAPDERGIRQVSERLANIESAAARARSCGGGVIVW
jgi:hypothetical protein